MENKNRWKPNNNINNIHGIVDLVRDNLGNYYTPHLVEVKEGKLIKTRLTHAFYDIGFTSMFMQDEFKEEYKHSQVGEYFVDSLNSWIDEIERSNRTNFTVQDLLDNGTEVYVEDIRKNRKDQ